MSTAGRADVHPGWRLVDGLVAVSRRVRLGRFGGAVGYLLIAPAALLMGVLLVGLVWLTWRSFHSFDPYYQKQGGLSLQQYRHATTGFIGSFYMHTLKQTFLVSVAVTASSILLALPVAYFMTRVESRVARLLALALILTPFLMGDIVRAFAWLLLFGGSGLVAQVANLLGLPPPRLLGTETAVWIGMTQMMVPIAALTMLPSFGRIPADLERAARTLGARPFQVWLRILIPLALSGLIGAAIVVFSLSMTSFAIPQVLGQGRVPFIANTIESVAFDGQNMYLASALGTMLVVLVTLVLVALALLNRFQYRPGRARG